LYYFDHFIGLTGCYSERQRFGEAPATVLIGGMKGYAVPPEHYGTLINDTKTLTNKKLSEVAMQQVFGSNSRKCGT
jgi:hypothetical protein